MEDTIWIMPSYLPDDARIRAGRLKEIDKVFRLSSPIFLSMPKIIILQNWTEAEKDYLKNCAKDCLHNLTLIEQPKLGLTGSRKMCFDLFYQSNAKHLLLTDDDIVVKDNIGNGEEVLTKLAQHNIVAKPVPLMLRGFAEDVRLGDKYGCLAMKRSNDAYLMFACCFYFNLRNYAKPEEIVFEQGKYGEAFEFYRLGELLIGKNIPIVEFSNFGYSTNDACNEVEKTISTWSTLRATDFLLPIRPYYPWCRQHDKSVIPTIPMTPTNKIFGRQPKTKGLLK